MLSGLEDLLEIVGLEVMAEGVKAGTQVIGTSYTPVLKLTQLTSGQVRDSCGPQGPKSGWTQSRHSQAASTAYAIN